MTKGKLGKTSKSLKILLPRLYQGVAYFSLKLSELVNDKTSAMISFLLTAVITFLLTGDASGCTILSKCFTLSFDSLYTP